MTTFTIRRGSLFASLVALSAATAVSTPVLAQEKRVGLEEVIVTARKVEESAQEIPVAITALSEELTSSTIRDLTDLNGYAPNVQIAEDGSRGGGGASITIRGISPTRTDDNSFDSPIGVMIDGIYLGSLAGQVLENFDLERVEILRGPQGTLFGKNTVGGVVHVIRSRPTGEFGARLKATVGNDGQREARIVANMPIIQDKLAAKVFMTSLKDDGFIQNETTGNKIPEKDYSNYGLTLLATPTDNFEALFTIEKFKDESQLGAYHTSWNAAPGVIPPPVDPAKETDYSGGFANCLANGAEYPTVCRTSQKRPSKAQMDTENDAELDIDAYTLNMSLDLNENLTLVSVTGYRDMDEYRIYDFDASAAPYITIERWNEYDQFSQELRIDGTWNNFKFTAGGYYWNSEFEQDWVTGGRFWASLFGGVAYDPPTWQACQGTNGLDGIFAPISCDLGLPNGVEPGADVTQILYETQETDSWAAFTQMDWTFAENWTLTAGIRYTEEKKDFKAGQSYLSNVERQRARNFPGYADLNEKWTDTSPKVGLTYQMTDNAIIYATYSEGFHSGGFFGVNQNIRDFERDIYDPERAESYEVGFKSTWMDNRLLLNITGFWNDFKDKQEQSVQQDPETKTVATVFDNAADARYRGFEVETQFVFNEYVRMFANYGYLDAEYKEFETDINPNDLNDEIVDASFLTPRNAPKNTVGVGGTLTFPIGAGEFEIFGKYAWVDKIETNLLNTAQGRLDSREDVTASAGYYTDRWSVVAFGRNLTDERTETFIPIATLFAAGNLNRPRSYGLEFTLEL